MSQKNKAFHNSLSMLVNKLTQGITTFLLSAAIARTLGAYSLGQYLLAASYYNIFVSLSSQGFKTLFTREIAREPEATSLYLVSGTLLQLFFSIIGYILMAVVVYLLPYNADTSDICYILGLTIIPFALSNITESIFQAHEKTHLIALATTPMYILRLLAMLWIMPVTHDVGHLAIIIGISETVILLIEWFLIINIVKPKWQIDRDFMWDIIKAVKTLFAIEGMGIIAAKVDVLILSLLGNEVLVGVYGSIMQLIQPFFIISNSLTLAAFPRMSRAVALGKVEQQKEAENIINILLCMGLPFLIGILFHGSELLLFIYQKPSFAEAGIILDIISVAIVTLTFSQVFSYVLISNGLEKFNLLEVSITTTIGSLVGILLISKYKLLGAAFMSLTMCASSFAVLSCAVHYKIFHIRLLQIFRLPLMVGSFMLAIFLLLQKMSLDLLLTVVLAICAYTILISFITAQKLGGFEYLRKKISEIK
jgi:O-antigen/teichoic acid export membrane protein